MCKKYGSYINDALCALGISVDSVFQSKESTNCFFGIDDFKIHDDGEISCCLRYSDGDIYERVTLWDLIDGYHLVFDKQWDDF